MSDSENKKSLSSFQDLQKLFGGESEPAEPEKDSGPGWTLKRADDAVELDLDELPDVKPIKRPPGFGPLHRY